MKFTLPISVLLGFFGLVLSTLAAPNIIGEEGFQIISEPQVDDVYAAGETIMFQSPVVGDIVTAGANITIDESVSGDVIAAGNDITINASTGDDVRIAGNTLTVNGNIADDLFAAGQKISINNSEIGGGIFIAGNSININGGSLAEGGKISGQSIYFNAVSNGDLELHGNNISFGENAQINGTLMYSGNIGETNLEEKVQGDVIENKRIHSEMNDIKEAGHGFMIGYFISILVFSLILLLSLPKFFQAVSTNVIASPFASLGLGALWFILVPIIAIILMITVIGIPFGIFILMLWIFLFFIFSYFCAATLAAWIMKKCNWSGFWLTLLATIIGSIIVCIPFTMVIIAPFVMGGIFIEKSKTLQNYR